MGKCFAPDRPLGRAIIALSFLTYGSTDASAAYDYLALGAPKFVNTNYIDMTKITRISKYRSLAGHNYSDQTQFGQDGIKSNGNFGSVENCSSMKHYFVAPDTSVKIYAPVSGTIGGLREGNMGSSLDITSDEQPDFHFGLFHVVPATPLAVGDHVTEGQLIGTHASTETWSDMSLWVQTPNGKHLISYFEVLTDTAFEAFKARGVTSRDSLIRTKAERAADSRVCSFTGEDQDFVNLTGGATSTQVISVQTSLNDTMNIGDAPTTVAATATSGLPVTFVSATPKICTVEGNAVTPRRAGICKVQATQAGNATTIEARPATLRATVLPRGVTAGRPRLGLVYPPTGSGPDSYIRFYNTGRTAGTVTASLIDGATGQTALKWESPSIAAGAAPQFSVRDIEGTLPPGYARPASYSLRIEPETTIDGYMQHVLFDPVVEAITNASTCDAGTTTSSYRLMNVHSSRLESGYPSTLVMFNHGIGTLGMNLTLRDAPTGTDIGRFYSSSLPIVYPANYLAYPNIQLNFSEAAAETVITSPTNPSVRGPLTPPSHHINFTDDNALAQSGELGQLRYFYQHLVTNRRPGVVADFTAMCALNGKSTATANIDMRASGILSSLQPVARSTLRFYNAGTTAGPVRVKLYGNTDDQPLGAWTSPEIPAGAVREFDTATIEAQAVPHRTDVYVPPAFPKQNLYGAKFEAAFDGLFQNVVRQEPSGAYANASTCFEATGVDAKTLIAVASSAREAEGYLSTVVVTNTGASNAAAKLEVYDARDGTALGSFQTSTIPANGLIKVDARAIETAANIPPDPARTQYVIKAEEAFTGFLQHLLASRTQGVVSDMTAACLM